MSVQGTALRPTMPARSTHTHTCARRAHRHAGTLSLRRALQQPARLRVKHVPCPAVGLAFDRAIHMPPLVLLPGTSCTVSRKVARAGSGAEPGSSTLANQHSHRVMKPWGRHLLGLLSQVPHTGQLKQQQCIASVLKAKSLKSRCWQDWVLLRDVREGAAPVLSSARRRLSSSCVFTLSSFRPRLYPHPSSIYGQESWFKAHSNVPTLPWLPL